jgi:hypothetical protein
MIAKTGGATNKYSMELVSLIRSTPVLSEAFQKKVGKAITEATDAEVLAFLSESLPASGSEAKSFHEDLFSAYTKSNAFDASSFRASEQKDGAMLASPRRF